jgi:hypothetical protein
MVPLGPLKIYMFATLVLSVNFFQKMLDLLTELMCDCESISIYKENIPFGVDFFYCNFCPSLNSNICISIHIYIFIYVYIFVMNDS